MNSSVLIIDGDPMFAENAQAALEEAGLTVFVRFEASLDDVRTLKPGVLMLSAELPRGSGFGLCSRIRRDPSLKETAIFMTTSEATQEALVRHARSDEPANDYAHKGIPVQDLVDRVSRLLAQVPTLAPDDQTPAPSTDRMTVFPPPLPRTDSTANGDRRRPASSIQGPVSGGQQVLDLWPRDAFDSDFRQAIASTVERQPKSRATPEQRIAHLRQLVKVHEGREKAIRQLWDQMLSRGQELARRVVTLNAELAEHRAATEQLKAQQSAAQQQRDSVQSEFQTFEEEIRRIFSEKDREEKALQAELRTLKDERQKMKSALEAAQERKFDDERRLAFLQEELDSLTTDKEQSQQEATDAAGRTQKAEKQVKDLTARLETAEHVARERAEALERLQEELDQLTYDSETALAQNTTDLDAARSQLKAVEDAHRAEVDSLTQQHRTEIETLTQQHVGQAGRFDKEIEQAKAKLRHLRGMAETSTRALVEERRKTKDARAEFEHALAVTKEEFERKLDSAAQAAAVAEAELATIRTETTERRGELERTLASAQGQLLDTRATLDQERTAHEAVVAELDAVKQTLDDVQIERDRLASDHAEGAQRMTDRDRHIEKLEGQQQRLEARIRDGDVLLEAARQRLAAQESECVALRAEGAAQQAELTEAREVQNDLEAQLNKLAHERSALEQSLRRLQHDQTYQRREADVLRSRLADVEPMADRAVVQEDELNESRFTLESIRAALGSLSKDLVEERRRAPTPRVVALIDRFERVISMSREAMVDDATPNGDPLSPFGTFDDLPSFADEPITQLRAGGSALAFDDPMQTETGYASLSDLASTAGLQEEPDEDGHVTEIIDITKVD